MTMRTYSTLFILSVFFFVSCKKNVDQTESVPPVDTTSAQYITNDSALQITREVYLWNTQIPADFDPGAYADPAEEMVGIRAYSMQTGFAQPVDRFSFAIKQSDWNDISSGVGADFGMSVFFNSPYDLRVKYAEQSSPSGRAGIQRGWRIIRINGNSNIDTSSSSINMIVDAVFYSSQTSFTFKKPDGTTANITLTAKKYKTHPIFADSVYKVDNNRVGYLVLNSFLGDTTEINNEFKSIFSKFAQQNVNQLIIDIRYNGGGYVSLAEKLANYLVPNNGDHQVMYKETFNSNLSDYDETALYDKLSSVNVDNIFFIVSDNTASASELLINALKPFVSETLVGPSTHTYGKPVGFFPIPVSDWYIFPVSFKTVNKDGNGDYFTGFTIDHPVADGVDKNWGDRNESCLNSVLTYIQTGVFGVVQGNVNISGSSANQKINKKAFKGAVGKKDRKR
ncbi:MAG TPA: S41 family peptidase [Parafilimonas sp.]|nr:S41 family peptidase [Parafilimonas sp.]